MPFCNAGRRTSLVQMKSLSLYMQLNYKPAIEIAEEEAINTVIEEANHYQDIRKRCDYDLMVLGLAMAKHEFLTWSRNKSFLCRPCKCSL